jgi:hypothetical protein
MTVWQRLGVLGADIMVGLVVFGIGRVFQTAPDAARPVEDAHD